MEDKLDTLTEIRARVSLRADGYPESEHLYILDGFIPVHVDAARWVQWVKYTPGVDLVMKTTPVGHFEVHTVFCGVDHSLGEGPLQLFFTNIGRNDVLVGEREWHGTWEEALEGHARAVVRARQMLN